jgi:hypothetical protein
MDKDYIPDNDNTFVDFLNNLLPKAADEKGALNVPEADLASLTTMRDTLVAKLAAKAAAKSACDASVQETKQARKEAERKARALAQHMQKQENMTDALRASFGLTVPDTEPTPAAAPASFPVVTIDTSKRLQHGLNMRANDMPNSRALPPGVAHVEINTYVGTTPPTSIKQFKLIDIATKHNFTVHYDSDVAGQTAYFNLRYVSTRGEKGPWSETVSATITG